MIVNNKLKNKKIVFLVISDFEHDVRVQKEARSAQKAGMKVTVLTPKTKNCEYIEVKDGYKIIRVESSIHKYLLLLRGYLKGGSSAVAPASISNQEMDFSRSLATIFSIWLINRQFVKTALKIKPDIVHANDPVTLPAGYKLKKKCRIKLIYDSHEYYRELLKNPHQVWRSTFIWVERKISLADGIFTCSPWILNQLIKKYSIDKIPKSILLNAPNYQKINPRKHNQKLVKIVYLGSVNEQRGVVNFFNAINAINNIEFTIISKENLSISRVNCLPAVSPEKIINTISDYDIGVIPFTNCSLSVYRSLPNKLFEYMMAGLAIVSYNLPEIVKVINMVENGIIVNPKNPKDFVRKINRLKRNPEILKLYKKNSLKAAKEYCWENEEKKQLTMYKKILQ